MSPLYLATVLSIDLPTGDTYATYFLVCFRILKAICNGFLRHLSGHSVCKREFRGLEVSPAHLKTTKERFCETHLFF